MDSLSPIQAELSAIHNNNYIGWYSKSGKAVKDDKKHNLSQTRKQLHLNTISKIANRARAFMGNFLCGVERVKLLWRSICIASLAIWIGISEKVDVSPPGIISADAHVSGIKCFQLTCAINQYSKCDCVANPRWVCLFFNNCFWNQPSLH